MATPLDFSGLFGTSMSPEDQQRLLIQQQALEQAKLSPTERLAYMGYQAGADLGRGIAGLMGGNVTDPAIQRRTQMYQLAQGLDTESLKGQTEYAKRLSKAGFFEESAKLGQRIREAELIEAQTTKNLRERAAADPLQQIIRSGLYTTPSVQQYAQTGKISDLELVTKPTKAQIKEVGVAEATREPVYTYQATPDSEPKQIIYKTNAQGEQVMVPYSGGVDRTTSKVSATATSKGEEAFTQELGKLDAKAVADAQKARDASIATVKALNTLASYEDSKLISGTFANNRVGVANFLNTIGLANASDKERISNSQQYQKVAGDVILQTLGGKLGSGFSNADREFIASLVPQLETSPQARRSLIEFMQRKNQDIIKEATNLEQYARQNKGLGGYTPTIPLSQAPTNPALAALSDDQIKALLAEKRKGK